MSDLEFEVDLGDHNVGAVITAGASTRGVCVALHGSAEPSREYFLYKHLASVLPSKGWDVLRYDRRPSDHGVPLGQQVADLETVIDAARDRLGDAHRPVGLWGFSQGAWTATMAASSTVETAFLVLVGFSAVSPAEQMRFATANYLRQAGYGDEEVADLARLRDVWESYRRGRISRQDAQAAVDKYVIGPWFHLAYVPAEVPPLDSINDPGFLDVNPLSYLATIDVPTLVIYGENDIDVPIGVSIAAIDRLDETEIEVVRLPMANHDLTIHSDDRDPILHSSYEPTLVSWVSRRC